MDLATDLLAEGMADLRKRAKYNPGLRAALEHLEAQARARGPALRVVESEPPPYLPTYNQADVILGPDAERDEWLAARTLGVGASDSPILLGAVSWSSPVRLWAEKRGQMPGVEESEAMAMGHRMEPVILRMVSEDLGATDHGLDGRLLRSTAYPLLQATLDGWLTLDGKTYPVEVKNSSRWESWSDGVPAGYFVQVQHQLAVTGEARALVAVLIRGFQLRWAWIDRDQDFIDRAILPAAEAFWSCVLEARMPPVDASPDTRKALLAIYPASEPDEEVQLPGTFVDLDAEYRALEVQAKVLNERIEQIKNEVRASLGSASVGRIANGTRWTYRGKNGRRSLRRQEG